MQHLSVHLIYPPSKPRGPAGIPLPVLGAHQGKHWAPLWGRCARRRSAPWLRGGQVWERARQGPFRQPLVCVLCLSALGSEQRGVGAGSLPSPRHAHLCHCSGALPAADQARQSRSRQRQLGNPGQGGLVGPPPAASGFGVTLLVTKTRPSPWPESARHRGVPRPAAWLEKVTFLGQGSCPKPRRFLGFSFPF